MKVLILLAMTYVVKGIPHFQIGACYGYFNFLSMIDYSVKLAFQQGFFDDVLSTTAFTFDISSVDTLCSSNRASTAGLPLFLGEGQIAGRVHSNTSDVSPVIAINGCTCSSASKVIANQAMSYTTPMVSGSSTSPDLSNNDLYKFFARTIPPDSLQSRGLVQITKHFGWKRAYGIHMDGDEFGGGLVAAYCDNARIENIDCLIRKLPYLLLDTTSLTNFEDNWHRVVADVQAIAEDKPSPRIFMAVSISIDWIVYAFRSVGLASYKHVWLLSETACSDNALESTKNKLSDFQAISSNTLWANASQWSSIAESIEGMACLIPNPVGPRLTSTAFTNFWNAMTKADLISVGYPVHADWEDAWLDTNNLVAPYWSLHFDGMTGILASIASMLNKGIAPAEIKGEALRAELFGIQYEGLSGQITFNSDGDRLAPYDLMNLQTLNGVATLKKVGVYDGASNSLSFSVPFLFGGGTTVVPLDGPAPCNNGSFYSQQDDACLPCAKGTYESQTICIACQQGTWTASAGATQCSRLGEICGSSGQFFDVTVDSCVVCPRGKAGDETGCKDCAVGTYSGELGETLCSGCKPGKYQGSVGQTSCIDCAIGNYQSEAVQKKCVECPAGFYATGGAQFCTQCVQGTYAAGIASSGCESCEAQLKGSNTVEGGATSLQDCVCDAGSYMPANSMSCNACPAGMTCPIGSKESGFTNASGSVNVPLLDSGFWSSKQEPLLVYECKPKKVCPGGAPETCEGGKRGIACGLCDKDRPIDDDGCKECEGFHVFGAILGIVTLMILPILLYPGVNAPHQWKLAPREALLITCEVIFELLQVCAAITLLDVDWPGIAWIFVDIFAVFRLEVVDIIPLPCLFPLTTDVPTYVVGCLLIPCMVLVTVSLYPLCSRVLPRICKRFPQWDAEGTFNLCGKVVNILFISQVMLSMVPMQCYAHPSGENSSVREFPSTVCWGGDHGVMLVVGSISLLSCIACFVYLVWELHRAPKRLVQSDHTSYMRRITFMVEDFKLNRYWWNIICKMQELFLGMVILFDPNNTRIQIAIFMMIFLCSILLWTRHWPYKLPLVNLMSSVTFGVLVMVLLLGTNKLKLSNEDEDDFSSTVLTLLLIGAFVMILGTLTLVIVNFIKEGEHGEVFYPVHLQRIPSVKELVNHWEDVGQLSKEDMHTMVESWEHHERTFLFNVLVQLHVPGIGRTGTNAFRAMNSFEGFGSSQEVAKLQDVARRLSDQVTRSAELRAADALKEIPTPRLLTTSPKVLYLASKKRSSQWSSLSSTSQKSSIAEELPHSRKEVISSPLAPPATPPTTPKPPNPPTPASSPVDERSNVQQVASNPYGQNRLPPVPSKFPTTTSVKPTTPQVPSKEPTTPPSPSKEPIEGGETEI